MSSNRVLGRKEVCLRAKPFAKQRRFSMGALAAQGDVVLPAFYEAVGRHQSPREDVVGHERPGCYAHAEPCRRGLQHEIEVLVFRPGGGRWGPPRAGAPIRPRMNAGSSV